jgi:hypothetical protein
MKARGTPMGDFMEYLRTDTDWVKAESPKAGIGLLEYGIMVAKELLELKEKEEKETKAGLQDESCILVGLFHKIGLIKVDGEEFAAREGEDEEVRAMRIASRGLRIIAHFIPVNPEEAQAIIYHQVKNIPVERKKITELLGTALQKVLGE